MVAQQQIIYKTGKKNKKEIKTHWKYTDRPNYTSHTKSM